MKREIMAHEKMATEIFEKETMEQRRYWLGRLSRELGASNIPLDYERPGGFSAEKESLAIELAGHSHEAIYRLANGSPFLVYVTLLAALNVCLQKYTGGTAVVVGSPSRKKADGSPREASALVIA